MTDTIVSFIIALAAWIFICLGIYGASMMFHIDFYFLASLIFGGYVFHRIYLRAKRTAKEVVEEETA